MPYPLEDGVSIINEDRLRELIDGRVKAMKSEQSPWTTESALCWGAIIGLLIGCGMLAYSSGEDSRRLSRLETIVAKDRDFAHGVAASVAGGGDSLAHEQAAPAALGPPVSIQPRAIAESELPAAKEGQP